MVRAEGKLDKYLMIRNNKAKCEFFVKRGLKGRKDWFPVAYTFNSEEFTNISIWLMLEGKGRVWFDNVCLEPISPREYPKGDHYSLGCLSLKKYRATAAATREWWDCTKELPEPQRRGGSIKSEGFFKSGVHEGVFRIKNDKSSAEKVGVRLAVEGRFYEEIINLPLLEEKEARVDYELVEEGEQTLTVSLFDPETKAVYFSTSPLLILVKPLLRVRLDRSYYTDETDAVVKIKMVTTSRQAEILTNPSLRIKLLEKDGKTIAERSLDLSASGKAETSFGIEKWGACCEVCSPPAPWVFFDCWGCRAAWTGRAG